MNSNSKPVEDFNEFDFSLSDSEDAPHPSLYESSENPMIETDAEAEKRLLRDIGAYDDRYWSATHNRVLKKTGKSLASLNDADVDNEIKKTIHRINMINKWQRNHRRSRSKKAEFAGVQGAKARQQPLRIKEKLVFYSKRRPSSAGGKRQKKTRRKSRRYNLKK